MTLEPELDFILAGPPGDPWCGPLLMPVGPQALGFATELRRSVEGAVISGDPSCEAKWSSGKSDTVLDYI